jgi:hypothetical protein
VTQLHCESFFPHLPSHESAATREKRKGHSTCLVLLGWAEMAWHCSKRVDDFKRDVTLLHPLHTSSPSLLYGKMAPYNPMKKHMEKLDEWGASQSKKLAATRDAGPGASISDRFNLARGKDDRWEKSKASRANEDDTNIVPQRSNRADRLPQAPSSFVGGKSPPPPPPQRGLSSGSSSNVPPPPARGKAPPPPLPRRMDNESGIDRPPPDYGTSLATASSTKHDYIEFSKFTEEDKQAFFSLLDEVSRRKRVMREYIFDLTTDALLF